MEFEYIDRRGTNSAKWDGFARNLSGVDAAEVIPMGMADMDFLCPPEVVEAVVKRAQNGLYGYSCWNNEELNKAAVNWVGRRYDWNIEKDWMVYVPGVVPAIAAAVQALTEPGDGVIIQPPVYHLFRQSIVNNDRIPKCNHLIAEDDTYRMDFEGLEQLAAQPKNKLMILCSPHNPVGRVWSREDLERVCQICARNNVVLVSDGIHADLLMKGVHFYETGPIAAACGCKCISCFAPSKTFNMAGIQSSLIVIPDDEIRARFSKQLKKCSMPSMNAFAALATAAAWTYGDSYVADVMDYIEANIDHAIAFFAAYTPKIKMRKPEGTYLGWIDLRGLEVSTEEAYRFFREDVKIFANEGTQFGEGGEGFVRVNFACHRRTLDKALEQLRTAYEKDFG